MFRKHHSSYKRFWALMTALALCMSLTPAYAQEALPMAELRDQTVRVHLSRLNITDRIDLTLDSAYRMTAANGTQLHFPKGTQLAFLLKGDSIYLYYQEMAMNAGKNLSLQRTVETDASTGFYVTNFPALYMGDLSLDVHEGRMRPVLSIHVEDYLLGVVPHEMGDSFPLEALKAQAVTARTYVLRKQNRNAAYDVVDTTNDQVFKGYQPGSEKSERAVAQTRGVCGFYKGKLAQCYYSASNGGQMELVTTVWPSDEDFGYYTFGEDPYDVENPLSMVMRYELLKTPDESAQGVLSSLVAQQAAVLLESQGFQTTAENIRIDSVRDAFVGTPVAEGNKRMTTLHLTLDVSARREAPVDEDTEEVSLFVQAAKTPQPNISVSPQSTVGVMASVDEPIQIELPIFPDAEALFGLDISPNYENEIWTVNETTAAFLLEARRYGHGVGMSQRGAQWMAGKHGMNYQQILGFYYPGMKLQQYPETPRLLVEPEEALAATAGPAPSPTPRPTLMPLTLQPAQGQWYAEVTNIADNSSLNLRAAPNLNADIVMRLYKGQRLLVLEEAQEAGWVRVQTDVTEGYVKSEFLTQRSQ